MHPGFAFGGAMTRGPDGPDWEGPAPPSEPGGVLDPEAPESLTRTTVRGISLAGAGYIVSQALNFLAYLVLVRLLTPRDFGLYAAGTLITGIGGLFAESGMLAALIKREDRLDEAASTAFAWLLVCGVALDAAVAGPRPADRADLPQRADRRRDRSPLGVAARPRDHDRPRRAAAAALLVPAASRRRPAGRDRLCGGGNSARRQRRGSVGHGRRRLRVDHRPGGGGVDRLRVQTAPPAGLAGCLARACVVQPAARRRRGPAAGHLPDRCVHPRPVLGDSHPRPIPQRADARPAARGTVRPSRGLRHPAGLRAHLGGACAPGRRRAPGVLAGLSDHLPEQPGLHPARRSRCRRPARGALAPGGARHRRARRAGAGWDAAVDQRRADEGRGRTASAAPRSRGLDHAGRRERDRRRPVVGPDRRLDRAFPEHVPDGRLRDDGPRPRAPDPGLLAVSGDAAARRSLPW